MADAFIDTLFDVMKVEIKEKCITTLRFVESDCVQKHRAVFRKRMQSL